MTQADTANATVRLGDLFRIKHGFAFKGEFFSDEPGDIVLTPGNFQDRGGLKFQPERDRSYTGSYPAEYKLSANDLLVVMTDLTQEARILGAPAFVPSSVCCLHNQRLGKVVDMDTDRLDRGFLYYVLNDYNYREYLRATATGSTVKHTSPGRIGDFRLLLPHLHEQQRIASILSAYDDLIEVNRRRVTILEEMARRLFEEWFVHLRFPGHEAVLVHDTPDGPLPEGWTQSPLSTVASLKSITVSPADTPHETVEHFSYPAFDEGRLPSIEAGEKILSNKLLVTPPAILLGKLNPRTPRIWPVLASGGRRQLCSTEFLPLVATSGLGPALLAGYIGSRQILDRLKSFAVGTSTSHQRVKPGDVLTTKVPLPPRDIMANAESQLAPLQKLVVKLREANSRLAAARDLLLPRLVSGELSVADAPTPARLLDAAD